MALSIVEEIANYLADMPPDLPVYPMQFPSDVVNCIAIFPAGGKDTERVTSSDATGLDYIEYPNIQIQVRYTDPHTAFAKAEEIRQWLDENQPTAFLICSTDRPLPDNLTNTNDLSMAGGPAYRFSIQFEITRERP